MKASKKTVNNAKASASSATGKQPKKAKDLTAFEKAYKERAKVSSECAALYRTETTSLKYCIDLLLNHPSFEAKRVNLTTLGVNLGELSASSFINYIPTELKFVYKDNEGKEFSTILKKAFPKDYTKATKIAVLGEYRRNMWSVRAVCGILDKSIKK